AALQKLARQTMPRQFIVPIRVQSLEFEVCRETSRQKHRSTKSSCLHSFAFSENENCHRIRSRRLRLQRKNQGVAERRWPRSARLRRPRASPPRFRFSGRTRGIGSWLFGRRFLLRLRSSDFLPGHSKISSGWSCL